MAPYTVGDPTDGDRGTARHELGSEQPEDAGEHSGAHQHCGADRKRRGPAEPAARTPMPNPARRQNQKDRAVCASNPPLMTTTSTG
jgi:hypothetical protein